MRNENDFIYNNNPQNYNSEQYSKLTAKDRKRKRKDNDCYNADIKREAVIRKVAHPQYSHIEFDGHPTL